MEPSRLLPSSSAALAVTLKENIMARASSRDRNFLVCILLPPLLSGADWPPPFLVPLYHSFSK